MKKVLALLLTLVFVAALAACGNSKTNSEDELSDGTESSKSESVDPVEKDDDVGENVVLFKIASDWDQKINVYYWSDKNENMIAWPGSQMEPTKDDAYTFELPDGVEYIIFNDCSYKDDSNYHQTEDIPFDGTVHKYQASDDKDAKGKSYVETWNGDRVQTEMGEGGEYIDDADEDQKQRLNKAVEYFEKTIGENDLAKYEKDDDEYNVSFVWDTAKSDSQKRILEMDVTFDGHHVTSGYAVSKLIADGFELSDEDEDIEAGTTVTPFNCEVKGGRRLYLDLSNTSDSTKKAKDCGITGINFMNDCKGVDYKGLTKDSTLEEVLEKLGLPDSVFCGCIKGKEPYYELHYGYGGNDVSFSLKYDSQKDTSSLYNMDF